MYRIIRPTTPLLIIKHYPWMQECVGLLFVVAGFCVAYFVFPNLVVLRCDRAQNICSLEQSNLFRSQVSQMALQDITAARLETIYPDSSQDTSGISYRISIVTRQGSKPFTPYSLDPWQQTRPKLSQVSMLI